MHQTFITVIALFLLTAAVFGASNPVVEYDTFVHKIGMLWNNITNHGEFGDDAYTAPAPSCEWPGGSGNSYLYAACIWLSAGYDDNGSVSYSVLNERDGEYSPIDSIHVFNPGDRSDQDTYTKYWDVTQPQSSSGDDPLGLTIEERTYAWRNPLANEFIITEYTIKNVGLDEDGDYVPEIQRDLYDFTFTIRMDGDVAKRADWSVRGSPCERGRSCAE
ncbi:MAG: hypothetical protein U5N26_09340 [Candidatus Marinimicrobia bacterium]|nr:hypothetical protein [Candidatus Neomarinimicrobiota bacterium]